MTRPTRQFFCTCGAAGIVLSLLQVPLHAGGSAQWEGDISEEWGDGDNWTTGFIPNQGGNVTFAAAVRPDSDLGGVTRDGLRLILRTENHRLYNGTLRLFSSANFDSIRASGSGLVHTLDIGLESNSGTLESWVETGCRVVVNGDVTAPLLLKKVEAGTLVLTSGSSSYAGGTIVEGGTLLINNTGGSATGSGFVRVDSGAILGGNGAVSGTVTALVGSTISPGESAGSLDLGAGVELNGTYRYEIDGTASDFLTTGDLRIESGTLDIDLLPGGAVQPVYRVASYGTILGTNAFATVMDAPTGYEVQYSFDDGTNANNIALVGTSPYNQWAISHGLWFADGTFDADPDGDGGKNGYEWATGTNPTNPASITPISISSAGDTAVVHFVRNTSATDVVIRVQRTSDLLQTGAWTGIATNEQGAWSPPGAVTESGTNNPVQVELIDSDTLSTEQSYRIEVVQ